MIALALIIGVFVLFVFLIWTKKFPLDELREPKRAFVVGNLFQLDPKAVYRTLRNWALDFPGLYKFRIFWNKIVVVSDRRAMEDVLIKQSKEFSGRPQNFRNKIYSDDGSGIAATDSGLEFRGRRQCIYLFLNKSAASPGLEDFALKSVERLVKVIADAKGKPLDGRELIQNAVIDILMSVLIGEPLKAEEVHELNDVLIKSVVALERGKTGEVLDTFPFHRYLGNQWFKKLEAVTKRKNELVSKWFEDDPQFGLIGHMRGLTYDDLFKFKLEMKEQQYNTAWDLILNGVYPMTSVLSMILNILVHRVDIQEKLRREVEETVKASAGAGEGGEETVPTLAHRSYMPYHQAVLLEACRYGCVVPLGKPHKAIRDVLLGPHPIPKDTEVWTHLWALHHNDNVWKEAAFEFRPDRFLEGDDCLVSAEHPSRRSFLAFGGGYRGCLGEDLAMSRMFLVLSRLVQKFRILPETTLDRQASIDPRDMVQCGEVLMPPQFKVRMEEI